MAITGLRKYEILADEIRKIISKAHRPGVLLPSDTELATRFGVSIPTVRRAMESLFREGAILRSQGKRTIVAGLQGHSGTGRRKKSKTILVLAVDGSIFFHEEVVEIQQALFRAGFTTSVCTTPPLAEEDTLSQIEEVLRTHEIDGLIIGPIHGNFEKLAGILAHAAFPVLFVQPNHPIPGNYVSVDNAAGTYQAARHLRAIGCTKIRYAGGGGSALWGRGRGIERFQDEFCLSEPLEKLRVLAVGSVQGGYAAASQLFAFDEAPDGIVAHNDLCAIGVMSAAKDHGIRVPEDLAIIGADDIADAAMAMPALTTVSPPKKDLAREAARILAEAIANPDAGIRRQVLLQPSLVLRESTYGFMTTHRLQEADSAVGALISEET